jgi:hypothetical protein
MPIGRLKLWWLRRKRSLYLKALHHTITGYNQLHGRLKTFESPRWHVVQSDEEVTLSKAEKVVKRKIENDK